MVDIDKYNLKYEEEDDKVEIDLINSDLESTKSFLWNIKFDSEEIKCQGKILSYCYGADIDLDFDEIESKDVSIPEEDYDEFKKRIENIRKTQLENLDNSVKTERYFYLTYLMIIKYLYNMDISQPVFDVEESEEYNDDLTLEKEDLRKDSRENIDKLNNSVNNISMYFSIKEDRIS